MSPQLTEKRVKLHELLKLKWQTIAELRFPKVNHFEYRSSLGIIRVYEEFKPDNKVRHIKLRWIAGGNKGKRITSVEIDNLIKNLE